MFKNSRLLNIKHILLFIFLFICIFSLSACGLLKQVNCEHVWEEEVETEATCISDGVMLKTCTICGKTMHAKIPASGHAYEEIEKVDPTCTEEGHSTKECKYCHTQIIETIPAKGHIAGDTIIDRNIPATCTEPGELSKALFCKDCHTELWRSTSTTPAIGHDWDDGVFVITPTTHNTGKKAFTCRNCNMKRYELVEKLYEDIVIQENTDGSFFSVKSDGYCPGDDEPISYTVQEGIPIDYRVEYSDQAKEQGFEDVDWTNVSADSRIIISTPEECQPGVYQANVYFRNGGMTVTKPHPVSFTVNLSKNYLVAIFEDVVSIDNRSDLFNSYQWFHNGKMI